MGVDRITSAGRTLLMGALILAWGGPAEVAAQQGTDPRWLAWLGCWEGESAAEGSLICIVPQSADVGIEMVAVEGGQVVSRELVRADGEPRESTREGCRGTERARFSEDGRRIYLEADHDCEGVARQRTTGMLALLSASEWIDVRSVQVGEGDAATGVSRYRLAPSDVAAAAGFGDIASDRVLAVRTARVQAAARIGVNDVIDASRSVSPEVVRAWIAERREPFRIDAAQLVRMADEGVSPDVIDVVIAVSYPRYFTLGEGAEPAADRRTQPEVLRADAPRVYAGYAGRFWNPFFGFSPYYDSFDRLYYGGYGYGSGYGYGYGFRPTVVVVEPRVEDAGGRVVNGRGYTRNRPNDTSGPSGAPSSSAGDSRSSGSSGDSGSSGTGGSGSSSSGGSSTGRTAKPRPPGR